MSTSAKEATQGAYSKSRKCETSFFKVPSHQANLNPPFCLLISLLCFHTLAIFFRIIFDHTLFFSTVKTSGCRRPSFSPVLTLHIVFLQLQEIHYRVSIYSRLTFSRVCFHLCFNQIVRISLQHLKCQQVMLSSSDITWNYRLPLVLSYFLLVSEAYLALFPVILSSPIKKFFINSLPAVFKDWLNKK